MGGCCVTTNSLVVRWRYLQFVVLVAFLSACETGHSYGVGSVVRVEIVKLRDEIPLDEIKAAFREERQLKNSPAVYGFLDELEHGSDRVAKVIFRSAELWEKTVARGYNLSVSADRCERGGSIITYPYAFLLDDNLISGGKNDRFYTYVILENKIIDNLYTIYSLAALREGLCFMVFGGDYLYGYWIDFKVTVRSARPAWAR